MNFNQQDDKASSGRGLPKRQLIAIAVLVAIGLGGGAAILASGPTASPKGGHGEHAEGGHDDHGHEGDKGSGEHKGEQRGDHKHEDKDEHAGDAKGAGSGDAHRSGAAGGEASHKEAGGKDDGHGHGTDEPEAIAMTEAQIKSAAIALETAGPASIRTTTRLPGEIGFNEDRTAHVVPRVAGVVEAVPATLGQTVRKGELLAVIASAQVSDQRSDLLAAQKREQLARKTFDRERKLWEEKISPRQDVDIAEQALREAEIAVANARQKLIAIGAAPGSLAGATNGGALTRFELRAPFDGVVVEKHLTLGEQVKEDASVFVLSDLRTVWARIDVPAGDLAKVRVGERAVVRSAAFEQSADGKVAYVGALIGGQSRTAQARISLANPDGAWRPGLFVNVDVVTGEAPAPVTVAADAVQVFEDRQVVFVRTAEGFAAQAVKTGRGDGRRIEIVDGLKAGAKVAAVNAFVIKSEAGKGSATHAH